LGGDWGQRGWRKRAPGANGKILLKNRKRAEGFKEHTSTLRSQQKKGGHSWGGTTDSWTQIGRQHYSQHLSTMGNARRKTLWDTCVQVLLRGGLGRCTKRWPRVGESPATRKGDSTYWIRIENRSREMGGKIGGGDSRTNAVPTRCSGN